MKERTHLEGKEERSSTSANEGIGVTGGSGVYFLLWGAKTKGRGRKKSCAGRGGNRPRAFQRKRSHEKKVYQLDAE